MQKTAANPNRSTLDIPIPHCPQICDSKDGAEKALPAIPVYRYFEGSFEGSEIPTFRYFFFLLFPLRFPFTLPEKRNEKAGVSCEAPALVRE
jgi:hypothetical protein